MQHFLTLLVAINLTYFFYDDLKSRSLHLFGLLTYLTLGVVSFVLYRGSWMDLILNILFLSLLLGLALIVVRILKAARVNQILGMGDVFFLYITTLFFDFPAFIVLLNAGLVFTLVVYALIIRTLPGINQKLIPLAGLLAVIFALAFIFETYVKPISSFVYQP